MILREFYAPQSEADSATPIEDRLAMIMVKYMKLHPSYHPTAIIEHLMKELVFSPDQVACIFSIMEASASAQEQVKGTGGQCNSSKKNLHTSLTALHWWLLGQYWNDNLGFFPHAV
ncbi:MAG: hypothetical protein K0Q74_84 [Gammaproteobacteria bacterium]|jgi:hypothetical protein|nr:hypothetical protein [Gammaproteobacteria bacterium]